MKRKNQCAAKVTIAVSRALLTALDLMAKREHRSRSGQVEAILSAEVARRAAHSQEQTA